MTYMTTKFLGAEIFEDSEIELRFEHTVLGEKHRSYFQRDLDEFLAANTVFDLVAVTGWNADLLAAADMSVEELATEYAMCLARHFKHTDLAGIKKFLMRNASLSYA